MGLVHMVTLMIVRQLYLVIEQPGNTAAVTEGCLRIERCVVDVHRWMMANKLKLNEDKTEIQVFGTPQRVGQVNIQALSIAGVSVVVSNTAVVNLGVAFDSELDMSSQISKTVRSAQYHLRNIGRIRNRLTTDAARTLVQSLVISRLDYCNSLLYGVPETTQLIRLRRIHHQAARLITRSDRFADSSLLLQSLHWLPIEYRIQFKTPLSGSTTVFRSGELSASFGKLLTVQDETRTMPVHHTSLHLYPMHFHQHHATINDTTLKNASVNRLSETVSNHPINPHKIHKIPWTTTTKHLRGTSGPLARR